MKPDRNDPCPCGSGRKYKKCCLAEDRSREESSAPVAGPGRTLPRAVALAAAEETAWEVDAVPLPVGIDGANHRPVAMLITAGELVIGHQIRDRPGGEIEDIAEALERAVVHAAAEVGSFPERIAVRFSELVEPLQARLGARGVRVHHLGELPNLEAAARELIHGVGEGAPWPPVSIAHTWATWRLPAASVREIFDAAAEFWKRAPWKVAANEQAPTVTLPSGRVWTGCVLGNGGEHFGLVLYSDPDDHAQALALPDPAQAVDAVRGRILSLGLDPQAQLPPEMVREARLSGWKTAGPRAFPILMTINTPGGGVSRADAEEIALLLRAIPDWVEAHREELLQEQRSDVPGPVIRWEHSATGTSFRYDRAEIDEREDRIEAAALVKAPGAGGGLPVELRRVVDEILESVDPDADPEEVLAEVNRRLASVTGEYNDQPRHEMGGLSPAQVHRLLGADWLDPDGPVRFTPSLSLEKLQGSELLTNARTVLQFARDEDGLAATESGNFSMAVVDALLDRLLPHSMAGEIRSFSTRITEPDVWPLHVLRILLELGGLIARRKRRYHLTPLGSDLLEDGAAGELFARLFATYFREFNMEYGRGAEWPGLQDTVPYTLYRLRGEARMWSEPSDLLPRVMLPSALDAAPTSEHHDLPGLLFEWKVLGALESFGLVERSASGAAEVGEEEIRYRVTRLYGEFLSFHF
jgi:hypothetical protein